MDAKQEKILHKWNPLLREVVNANDLLGNLPQFVVGSESYERIHDYTGSNAEKFDNLLKNIISCDDPQQFKKFVNALKATEGYTTLGEILENDNNVDDNNAVNELCIGLIKDREVLTKLTPALLQMKTKIVCDCLKSQSIITTVDSERITAKTNQSGDIDGMVCLLNVLARKPGGDWLLKLRELAIKIGVRAVIEAFENIRMEYSILCSGKFETTPTEYYSEEPNNGNNAQPIPSPTEIKGNNNKNVIQLRSYQLELAELATKGKNVIICAPTGSGKTHVASFIIEKHLESNVDAKVLFFVPRVSLAKQQCQSIQYYLGDKWRVDYLVGDKGHRPEDVLRQCSVLVLTPQLLVTAVEEHRIYSVTLYSMLIFDECHHAKQGDPYVKIMNSYFKAMQACDKDEVFPQVIGLTATPGVGRKMNDNDVEAHIIKLCANLDATSGIVTVQKPDNIDELNQYTPHPEEDNINIEDSTNDPFTKEICEFMDKLIEKLNNSDLPVNIKSTIGRPTGLKGTQQFMQWCDRFQNTIASISKEVFDKWHREIQVYSKYLKVYNDALDMHFKCRAIDAFKLLEQNLPKQNDFKLTNTEKVLMDMSNKCMTSLHIHINNVNNDKLDKIENLILKTFEEEQESRVILSVLKRKYTGALKDWLIKTEKLKNLNLNAQTFTGTGKGREINGSGLTHSEQEMILDMFKKGDTKIIVTTPDAVNEGVDVVHCNLVICYDYIKNEISSQQISGRARKQGGKVIKLSSRKVYMEDMVNIAKTKTMNKVIKVIQKNQAADPQKYLSTIEKQQKIGLLEQKLKQKKKNGKAKGKNVELPLTVYCKKCSVKVCTSDEIRSIGGNVHICINKDFDHLIDSTRAEVTHGDFLCKECGSKWGKITAYKALQEVKQLIPECFVFLDIKNDQPYIKRKWQALPFCPEEMDYENLLLHYDE